MNGRFVTMVRESWRQYIWYGLIVAGATIILWHQLYKLIPVATNGEVIARDGARTYQLLLENPLFLPHKVLQLLAYIAGLDGLLTSRLISTLFALLVIVFFYRVIRTWYTPRMAFFASTLLLTSSWFLHTARSATPTIMFALSIGLFWAGLRLSVQKPRNTSLVIATVLTSMLLFVPGFIWLIIGGVIWQRKKIRAELQRASNWLIGLASTALLASVSILGYAFWQKPSLALEWLGMPTTINLLDTLTDFVLTPYHLFVRAPFQPDVWLGRIPYIPIALTILFGFGCYVLYKSITLDRMRALIAVFLVGSLLASLQGAVSLVIILPIIFVAIAAGLALLLQQWFTVFPRNPIARGVGIAGVGIFVLFASTYGMYQYFIAWPKNPDTKAAISRQVQ